MNDDKYIGIENLSHTVNSMTALLDDRNALLNSMFKNCLLYTSDAADE